MNTQLIEILMVEDSPTDADLTFEAFRESKLPLNLSVVTDGQEAMAFLRRQHKYNHAPRPDLILLDLNLPKMNGHEVLSAVKNDSQLRAIPIVVLTTSQDKNDIMGAYNQYANSYVTKPVDLNQFLDVVATIEDYWLTLVKLPNTA